MPVFHYVIADRKGAVSRGTAEAPEQAELINRFRERGQVVLSLRETAGARAAVDGIGMQSVAEGFRESFKRMSSGVSLSIILLFTGQLAAMLGGGLHLVRILTALAAESTHKVFSKVLERVRDDITAGATFADSLAQHPHVFNRLYVSIVRAGEVSGSLPVVLDTLTTYLEKTESIRRKVKGAIAYPALLFALYQTPGGRRFFDTCKLKIPLFGGLIRKAILARTCRTLSVLLNAGIPLIEAMETVSKVAGNSVIEQALTDATQRMRDGGTIAETLRQTGHFPSMVTQLVSTGEESGTLPGMLGKAAAYYEQQVDQSVATLSSLIEPIMIVIMGGIAGGVIFALYLPIFNLGQAMRGR